MFDCEACTQLRSWVVQTISKLAKKNRIDVLSEPAQNEAPDNRENSAGVAVVGEQLNVVDRDRIAHFLNKIKPVTTQTNLIRLGGRVDGGYLIPDDLEGISAAFSPGVSTLANFERDLAERGLKCYLADYSVDHPPLDSPLFEFDKTYLGSENNQEFSTLENWVNSKPVQEGDLLLQMDIEGYEYDVFFSTDASYLKKFRIMVVEFHGLDRLSDESTYRLVNSSFDKILSNFEIVHIHPNNCCKPSKVYDFDMPPVVEFTFLRKDRITTSTPTTTFPHELDYKNVPRYDEVLLPECWYLHD